MSLRGGSLDDDEREAASIVASLGSGDAVADVPASLSRKQSVRGGGDNEQPPSKKPKVPAAPAADDVDAADDAEDDEADPPMDATARVFLNPRLRPAPYFYYTDHSLEEDDDPLTPITTSGSVPTFPAKMHAILTNPALAGIVAWAPHGRSWRIIKPRSFEAAILPKFFEHSKFSSFVRQANGWGFRRIAKGHDKNAYYHEYFLRSMPWLCKQMRRPKVAEKKAVDPAMEPDLAAISRERPVRDEPPTREVLVLRKTIDLGPRARMPVLWDTDTPPAAPSSPALDPAPARERGASDGDLKPAARTDPPVSVVPEDVGAPVEANAVAEENHEPPDCAAAAAPDGPPGGASAADPFAAGFLAATAYHSNQMRGMLNDAYAAGVVNGNASLPLADARRGNGVAAGTAAADLRALGHLQRAGRGQGALPPAVSAAVAARARGHPDIAALRAAAHTGALYEGPGVALAAAHRAAAEARGLEMLPQGPLDGARLHPRGYPGAAASLGENISDYYGPGVAAAGAGVRGHEMPSPGTLSDALLRSQGHLGVTATLKTDADVLRGRRDSVARLVEAAAGVRGLEMRPPGTLSNGHVHLQGQPGFATALGADTRSLYGAGTTVPDIPGLEMPLAGSLNDPRLRLQGNLDVVDRLGTEANLLFGAGIATADARNLEMANPGSASNQALQRLQQLRAYRAQFE